jgi:hypothetical protein
MLNKFKQSFHIESFLRMHNLILLCIQFVSLKVTVAPQMSDVIIKRTRIHQLGGSCLCHFEIVGHNLIKDDVETKEVFANS